MQDSYSAFADYGVRPGPSPARILLRARIRARDCFTLHNFRNQDGAHQTQPAANP